jgi:hypothetical protein
MSADNPSRIEAIDAIRSAFGKGDPAGAGTVAKANVRKWMQSSDIEVRGALYSKITDAECIKHIEPPLQFEDYVDFVVLYLEQCIEQDSDGDWAHSRYLAGYELVAWIKKFWSDGDVPRSKLEEIKQRLASLYKQGDKRLRTAVANAVLEHLFEDPQLVIYFADWKNDPVLTEAYDAGREWSEKV